jgi:hypothetical protein
MWAASAVVAAGRSAPGSLRTCSSPSWTSTATSPCRERAIECGYALVDIAGELLEALVGGRR